MANKTRSVDFEMQIHVSFGDEEAAKAYFIDGDWRNSFWDICDLDELAEILAYHFHMQPEYWDSERVAICRSPEGFGLYVQQADGRYVLCEEGQKEIGTTITVKYASVLAVTGVFALENNHDT